MAEKDDKPKKDKGGDSGAKKAAKKFKPYAKHRSCPKCGSGVRLAEHADRHSCGKCGYFEKK